MDDRASIERIRDFHRTVTARVGALDNDSLARSRPLGASRVLWEIGAGRDGTDTRTLRTRLGLDSGYLSRLLRLLEREGLIVTGPSATDQRRRHVRLTPQGVTERVELDRRSDELARSLLAPLDEARRLQLVAAMDTVTRLLRAGLVEFSVEDPASADALFCLSSYYAELHQRFDHGFDSVAALSADPDELRPPAGLFVVARLRGAPVGCGALKFHSTVPAYIKRMWVAPDARGLGVGRRLLQRLETLARERGDDTVHLETNRNLTEAIHLYRSTGYEEVSPFNDEPYAHHWFRKRLD